MMQYEVRLPSLGDEQDAVTGGRVSMWIARPGELVQTDGDLLELTTDKAAFVVPSPATGILVEQRVVEGDTIRVGTVIAVLEV